MHGSPKAPSSKGTPGRPSRPKAATSSPAQPSAIQLSPDSPNKSTSTFYSCLSIPVQGAKPINSEDSTESTAAQHDAATPSGVKRAPRKSKTDAIAALTTQPQSKHMDVDDDETADLLAEAYRNVQPIQVPHALDLESVRTARLRDYQPPAHVPRPFELENCPSFRPTTEEFRDPMTYIKSISDEAKKYGICKVIPPEDWEMPFVTDTEV
jgi:[histone H3]-trimethyl-L-lysine4 demethylase